MRRFNILLRLSICLSVIGIVSQPITVLAADISQDLSVPTDKALVYLIQRETQNFNNISMYVDHRNIGQVKANS